MKLLYRTLSTMQGSGILIKEKAFLWNDATTQGEYTLWPPVKWRHLLNTTLLIRASLFFLAR